MKRLLGFLAIALAVGNLPSYPQMRRSESPRDTVVNPKPLDTTAVGTPSRWDSLSPEEQKAFLEILERSEREELCVTRRQLILFIRRHQSELENTGNSIVIDNPYDCKGHAYYIGSQECIQLLTRCTGLYRATGPGANGTVYLSFGNHSAPSEIESALVEGRGAYVYNTVGSVLNTICSFRVLRFAHKKKEVSDTSRVKLK